MGIEALAVKKLRPRDVRTELGLTQRELGALAGISHVTVVKAAGDFQSSEQGAGRTGLA